MQFSPSRLNDGAGDPYWVDLTREEAQALLAALQTHLDRPRQDASGTESPLVFTLPDPAGEHARTPASTPAPAAPAPMASRQWVCVICGWIYDEAVGKVEPDDIRLRRNPGYRCGARLPAADARCDLTALPLPQKKTPGVPGV